MKTFFKLLSGSSIYVAIFLISFNLNLLNVFAEQDRSWCDENGDSSWTQYSSKKCYKLITEWMSWQQASDRCLALSSKARLASIKTQKEQSFVSNFLFNRSGVISTTWLGGYRPVDKFLWISDGENFDYTNWMSGRPINGENSDAPKCLAIDQGSRWNNGEGGFWRDVYCNTNNFWVLCELTQPIDMDQWKELFMQFQRDLDQAKENMAVFKDALTQSRTDISRAQSTLGAVQDQIGQLKNETKENFTVFRDTLTQSRNDMSRSQRAVQDEIGQLRNEAKENFTVFRDTLTQSRTDISRAQSTLREAQYEIGQLRNQLTKSVNDIKNANEKSVQALDFTRDIRKNLNESNVDIKNLQNWAGLFPPRAQMFSEKDHKGTVEDYNWDPSVYNPGCQVVKLSTVRSINTANHCVRIYERAHCAGRYKAIYPGSAYNHQDLDLGFAPWGIGPCIQKPYGTKNGMYTVLL